MPLYYRGHFSFYKNTLYKNDIIFQIVGIKNNKYILKGITDKNETVYEMTADGRQAISLVQDLIPGFTRFQIDNNFKEDLRSIEDEYSITADFIPESENAYTVVCKITENGRVTFEVKTFAGSREHAKSIVDNWKKNAVKLYPKMLKMLTK